MDPGERLGTVERIWTAPEGSAPMERRDSVGAVEGGLEGDRYLEGSGYYSPYDVCQVTLIESEAIAEIRGEFGIDLADGRHRRNLVTEGVDVHDLLGTTFRIGGATMRGTRPRPPCAHVEDVAEEEGVARALKERRGGVCADVLDAGEVRPGDALEPVEDDPRSTGKRIADRLRGR
jgi:MOSC domain-containing protein YiiM